MIAKANDWKYERRGANRRYSALAGCGGKGHPAAAYSRAMAPIYKMPGISWQKSGSCRCRRQCAAKFYLPSPMAPVAISPSLTRLRMGMARTLRLWSLFNPAMVIDGGKQFAGTVDLPD